MIRLGVLTISDRAAHGQAEDRSGPLIVETMVRELGAQVVVQAVVADERPSIESLLVQWADGGQVDLVLTTGGTGFAPRDVTPEATASVTDRPAPGFAEAMRAASLHVTPHAMFESRHGRHPQPHADHQPAGQPESGGREPGGHHAGPVARRGAAPAGGNAGSLPARAAR